jgi:hypothetical protein
LAKERAAVGFTIKSGWAAVVLVTGSAADPVVAWSRRVEISDPEEPDAKQPFHAGFGTARGAGDELRRLVASVKSYGRKSIGRTLRECEDAHVIRGVGVVAGSLIDPKSIANDHIRIHAMEGRLFRTVVIGAAEARGLACHVHRERDLSAAAAKKLNKPEPAIRRTLAAIGRGIDGGWRAEQKAAALSAWMLL